MFTADEIQSRLRGRPFVPLRIMTSAGQSVDVHHPDLVLVGRRDLIVGSASTENPSQYDQIIRIAILHIAALQDLPSAAGKSGNGQQS
jgi:hypothetical protein